MDVLSRPRAVVEQDRFTFGVRTKALDPAFPAESRFLEAPARYAHVDAKAVLADISRQEATSDAIGATGIVGENGGVEARPAVVGDLDRLIDIVISDQRQHR